MLSLRVATNADTWPMSHSERSVAKSKNLSNELRHVTGGTCVTAGASCESAFPDAHGKCVCQMCNHHVHSGLPHFEGPLPPSAPAGSRHASCGTAHYQGLYSQPPLGKTRRKQACLSAGTGACSSRHGAFQRNMRACWAEENSDWAHLMGSSGLAVDPVRLALRWQVVSLRNS